MDGQFLEFGSHFRWRVLIVDTSDFLETSTLCTNVVCKTTSVFYGYLLTVIQDFSLVNTQRDTSKNVLKTFT
jgi:hypothetical protein